MWYYVDSCRPWYLSRLLVDDTFLNATAWGPLFGPHIAFAGGVAAAAYAAKTGKLKSGGKDIVASLMGLNAPDVLLVGGVFGSLGYALLPAVL